MLAANAPIRVLHVSSSQDWRTGGVVTALTHLLHSQYGTRVRPSMAATFQRGEDLAFSKSMAELGIPVTLRGPTTNKRIKYHSGLRKVMSAAVAQTDIVHLHGVWEEIQYQAASAAARLRVPFVISPHGMLDPWSLHQNALMKKIYLQARLKKMIAGAAVMHFTTDVERDLTASVVDVKDSVVIPNGVDLSEFANLPAKGEFRARFPKIGNRRIILFLGRIHQKKGLYLLLPALAKAQLNDCVLVIAGKGFQGYQGVVEQLVEKNGISDAVIFADVLRGRERLEAFVDAELFVLASRQENFGIAVVESMACETPALISDQVNIHAQVSREGVAWVTKLHVDDIARSLTRIMSDPAMLGKASSRCRDFVRANFDRNLIAVAWESEYSKLLPWAQPGPSA